MRKNSYFSIYINQCVHLAVTSLYFAMRVLLRILAGESRYEEMWTTIPILTRLKTTAKNPLFYMPISRSRISLAILPNGMKLLCPYEDMFIISEIFIDQIYNRMCKLANNHVVIDVGAHVGVFTLKASKEVGEKGLVVPIEPNPSTFNLLKANLDLNQTQNIVPIQLALSNVTGNAKLFQSEHPREDSLVNVKSKNVLVNLDRMDNVISKMSLKRVDFIKIDVEGAELQVLEGAEKTIAKYKPCLAIAAYHKSDNLEAISNFLLNRDFQVFISKPYIYAK